MLEVYYGNDTEKVRAKVQARVAALKQSGVEVSMIDADGFTPGVLRDAVGANSLFGEALGFVLDMPSVDAELAEETKEQLAAMAESVHAFLVLEGPLLAAAKKPYAKHAATIEEFKKAADQRFNTFALADALASKNKKQLWLLLQEARAVGEKAEGMIGILWWQLKALRLAALTGSAAEAGMKDFPYNKAKRSLAKFGEGEVEKLSASLLALYHDGHAGMVDIDDALEEWVLRF